jgi:hypothetical protein
MSKSKLTLKEALSIEFSNECHNKSIKAVEAFVNQIKEFYPVLDVEINTEGEGQYLSFTDSEIILQVEPVKIIIKQMGSIYKNEIYLFYRKEFKNLRHSAEHTIKNTFKAPNAIYKPTTKKIQAWIDYLNLVYTECERQNNERQTEIDRFYASIKNEPVRYWRDRTEGEIRKGGLIFTFKIEYGFVYKRIQVDSVDSTIENFNLMADNKLKV